MIFILNRHLFFDERLDSHHEGVGYGTHVSLTEQRKSCVVNFRLSHMRSIMPTRSSAELRVQFNTVFDFYTLYN